MIKTPAQLNRGCFLQASDGQVQIIFTQNKNSRFQQEIPAFSDSAKQQLKTEIQFVTKFSFSISVQSEPSLKQNKKTQKKTGSMSLTLT